MEIVDTLEINTFGNSPKTDVPPSEDPIFVLTSSQLRQIVADAIQPLQDEVMELKATVASQGEKIAALESTQDTQADNQLIQLRLIHKLREEIKPAVPEPTATESERIERIEKLCTDAPKHEISLSELRGRLGIDKAVLSRLLKRIDADKFYLRKSTLDKRIRYLCLRPEVR